MQEQAISLDEVDQNGNTAVHVAAQYGHLTCIQVSLRARTRRIYLHRPHTDVFVCPDSGGVRVQRDGPEPAGGASVSVWREAGPQHLYALPGGGRNLHVSGLTGGETHQAAERVSSTADSAVLFILLLYYSPVQAENYYTGFLL